MPRTNRSARRRLPVWILLICFFSTGPRAAVAAADANSYETPAREFARRIASDFPTSARVGVDVRNRSTLAAGDAAAVRAAMLGELAARGLRVVALTGDAADAANSATITLSENVAGFLWIAEIRQGDRPSTMLMAVPRAASAPRSAGISGISLLKTLLWSGPEHVLAAAMPPLTSSVTAPPAQSAGSSPVLLLLVTDGAATTLTDAQHTFKIALPQSSDDVRDAQGILAWNGTTLTSTATGQTCTFSLPLAASEMQCHADTAPHPAPAPAAQLGSQRAVLPPACGGTSGELLAAGTGDYTQPGSIRAYEMRDGAPTPHSPAIEFPGPVMALDVQVGSAALAVVHNLGTGDDEVYEISLVCGR